MPTPKSVVKFKKNGIEYTSNIDAAQYYIFELTRAALRDVGKFVSKKFRDSYLAAFKKRTGKASKATKYKVWSSKTTKYPRVQVGLKIGDPGFYGYFEEFGSSQTPKMGLLTHSVQDNISEIIKIESQYLSALSGDEKRLSEKINEDEMEGDADGEN